MHGLEQRLERVHELEAQVQRLEQEQQDKEVEIQQYKLGVSRQAAPSLHASTSPSMPRAARGEEPVSCWRRPHSLPLFLFFLQCEEVQSLRLQVADLEARLMTTTASSEQAAALEARIAELEEEVEQVSAAHRRQAAELEARVEEEAAAAAALRKQLEGAGAGAAAEAEALRAQLAQQAARVAELEAAAQESDGLLERLTSEVSRRDTAAAELERRLEAQSAELQRLQVAAAGADPAVRAELAAKTAEVEQLMQSVALLEERLQHTQQGDPVQIRVRDAQIAELQAQLEALAQDIGAR